ncbi:MAG: YraN family protein [Clostridiales bacterium]|nr:YraN family protein [Clostridiales bacterium]
MNKLQGGCALQNNRRVGTLHEAQVADWMKQQGYQIQERNFRCRLGEIDIIAKKEGCIVFVEVKYRSNESHGVPQEAVDFHKQQRISNAASYYLYITHCSLETPCRFDVAAVSDAGIQMIENAFPYCGKFGG